MAEHRPDPQRRRLTVSQCDLAALSAVVGEDNEGSQQTLQEAGVEELFNPEFLNGRRAVLIWSVTDTKLKRKESFGEKDTQVWVPVGADPQATVDWVHQLGIGYTCRKGLKPEQANQDSYFLLVVEDDFALLSVLDGHGPNGHHVSDHARKFFVQDLVKRMQLDTLREGDPEVALHESFLACQQSVVGQKTCDPHDSGTTCTMAFLDYKIDKITVAHVGDSRSVFSVQEQGKFTVTDVTVDHKPDLPEEKHRIENSNPPGRVVFDGFYNHRVFAKAGNYPGLNMSRALGDVIAHREAGLSAKPDTKTLDLSKYREKGQLELLLCTDGVWEFIESSEALEIVGNFEKSNGQAAMTQLARESWDRWMRDSENEISDDITAMRIQLS
jgi:serine/threonine protein phosphatase PrpC